MYPSRDTTPPDAYPFADLPATLNITLDGVLYEGATKEDIGGGVWRYVHPDYEGGTVPLIRTELGNGWFFGDDGGLGSSGCLIAEIDGGATKAEDIFPNELFVSLTHSTLGSFSFSVFRDPADTRCRWSTDEPGLGEFFIWYGATPYLFSWEAASGGHTGDKSGTQDSPVGSYSDGGPITGVTVS